MARKFDVLIDLVDRFSAPFTRINRNISAMQAPLGRLSGRMSALSKATGLSSVAGAARGAAGALGHLGGQVGGLVGPMAALGAVTSAGGILESAHAAAEFAEDLENQASKTGVAADQLARWHHIAEASAIPTETMDKSLQYLNRSIAEAASGKNKDLAMMFNHLGISLRDSSGKLQSASKIFPKLSDAIKRNTNPAIRTRIAMDALGRSGVDLMPILEKGADGISEMSAEYEKYYGKISPEMLKSMGEGTEAFDKAELAAKGMKLTIGASLIPAVTKLVNPMTEWAAANRQVIAGNLSRWTNNVVEAMKKVDWAKVGHSVMTLAHAAGAVMKFLGPMGTMIAGLVMVFSPLIMSTLGVVRAFGLLGKQILLMAARLAMLAFAQVAGMVMNFITAIRAGYGAMEAFNLILAANPIGVIITAVAALAAAAFLIYRYWTPIKAFFAGLWNGVLQVFQSVWAKIKPIIEPIMQAASWVGGKLGLGGGATGAQSGASPLASKTSAMHQPLQSGGAKGAAGKAGSDGAKGAVHVQVDFKNAPQGTKVRAASSGNVSQPNVGTRFAMG